MTDTTERLWLSVNELAKRVDALEQCATLASPEPTADVEGLSERDKFMRTTGQNEGSSDYINSAEYLFKHAPPSDSQAEGCQCPCHREGLWKLPDEITRFKKVVDGYHETLKATKAELDTAYERIEALFECVENSHHPYPVGLFDKWIDDEGKAIRNTKENEDDN